MQSNKSLNELLNWAREYQVKDILENQDNLLNLKSLDFSFKRLHSIPKYIFELSSLENLNLSHNQLQELPQEITRLKSLKVLDISWNHITHNLDFLPTGINVNRTWNR